MLAALPFPEISPIIFSIPIPAFEFSLAGRDITLGGFDVALRWYALAYIVGILFARWLALRFIERPHMWPGGVPALSKQQLEDFITWVILGVIVGGRLGYVVFYQPSFYLANPFQALMITDGGMSFHGGFLGVVTICIIFCRKHNIALAPMADLAAICTPMALFLGRTANFVNAELWGRETTMPWGVIFPGDFAQSCVNAAYGACARHPSQLYEALGEGVLLGLIFIWLLRRHQALRVNWVCTGVFLIGYGLTRFLVEFIRQPDAQFQTFDNPVGYALQLGSYGLTMGQILTLPMIVIGVVLALRLRRA